MEAKEFIKEFPSALKALLLFKPYTIWSRKFEIACGVIAWNGVALILYGIIKGLLTL